MFSTGKWSGLDICAKCPISSVAHVINYSLHVSDKVGLLYSRGLTSHHKKFYLHYFLEMEVVKYFYFHVTRKGS